LPEVAESTFQKAKKTFSFGKKKSGRAGEGSEKVFFPGPHPPSSTVTSLPEGEGKSYGILRLILCPGYESLLISFLQIDQLC